MHTESLEPVGQRLLTTRTDPRRGAVGGLFLGEMHLNEGLERVAVLVVVGRSRTDRVQLDGLVGGDLVRVGGGRERGDPERGQGRFARIQLSSIISPRSSPIPPQHENSKKKLSHLLPLQLPRQPILFLPRNLLHLLLIQLKHLLPLPTDNNLPLLERRQRRLLSRLIPRLSLLMILIFLRPTRVLQPHTNELKLTQLALPRLL